MSDSGHRATGAEDGDSREWNDPPGVGDEPDPDVVEPGRPSAENAAFVLLGVLVALYVIARLAGLV